MKNFNFRTIRNITFTFTTVLLLTSFVSAAAIVRSAAGANAAAIQATVDQFRTDLGALNPNTASTFATGRREINWDGVPDAFAAPNNLPANFFNVNSPRGVVFSSVVGNSFMVSSSTASGVPLRFGNLDASYTAEFTTFSSERLFAAAIGGSVFPNNVVEVNFFIPGTKIPATVSGFGVVFTDVDTQGLASIELYAADGTRLGNSGFGPPAANNGLSFVGVFFNAGERVARVVITSGNNRLVSGNTDGVSGRDIVAMDDFIYGEPRASQFHSGDFDGDGVADSTVFRPATGDWFILNSGSNTVTIDHFGQNGDVPIDGDFDGDQKADTAIYRQSLGQWWFKRSTDGTNFSSTFGNSTDKPVPGDYDKDGKTDFAVWRPSNGNWFVARSSDGYSTFYSYPFGQNGDNPVGASVYP